MATNEQLQASIDNLPERPGVYQYFDKSEKIIYVGKAKNLKKRVKSYFTKHHDNYKTKVLVSHIHSLKFIVVDSELDALLLENNLIKTYQPKYNIQLKDDKTYPWIVVKNEPFPRVFQTRQKRNDGSTYFGPYPNVKVMQTLLSLIQERYTLRTCALDLQEDKIAAGKFKTCLEFHIGRCKAPCVGYQSRTAYDELIAEISLLLKGKTHQLLQQLKQKMADHAAAYEFEKAHETKLLVEQIEKYRSKSSIVSPSISDTDVLTFDEDDSRFFFNYLVIEEGAIVHAFTSEVVRKLDETADDILSYILPELRHRFESSSKQVVVEQLPLIELPGMQFNVPSIGDKKRLIELSKRNVSYYKLEQLKKATLTAQQPTSTDRILVQIQHDFKLKELPVHIECFDNSNIQGTHPVSACVVFKNARPSKKDYRHFNVKTVEGPDDFATMKEAVFRRYRRLLEEEQSLPQLIVIDGGKGQLGAACEALRELNIYGKVAIVGIAKRLEEIFFPGDMYPLYLDKRSESLKVIQYLRNEAHRFGITHHRNRRSKAAVTSELEQIEGIGEKTIEILFKKFKSIEGIEQAEESALEAVVGKAKAKLLKAYFEGR